MLLAVLAGVLGGCASGPPRSASSQASAGQRAAMSPDRDGPEANPPPDLAQVPDAEPKLEVIRSGGPNKPYEVLGREYVPITKDRAFTERGLASWYGRMFHGRRTASGEVYNMYAMTAAHPTLPIPSYARVRNPANGREVLLRINDRGPFVAGRIIDLSYTAALKLDLLRNVAPVELERITYDDIRTGAWRRDFQAEPVRVALTPPNPPSAPAVAVVGVVTVAASTAEVATIAPTTEVAANLNATAPSVAAPASTAPQAVVAVAAPAVADAPVARAYTAPARGFWVQLGAFRQRDGAEGFQSRVAAELDWLSPLLAVFSDSSLFRLQAGPYPSRDEAQSVAQRVRLALQLVPVIVERR